MEQVETTTPAGGDAVEHRAIGTGRIVRNRRAAPDEDVKRAPSRGAYRDRNGKRRIVGAGQPVPAGWVRIEDASLSGRATEDAIDRAGDRKVQAEREAQEDKAKRGSREDRQTQRGDKAARTEADRAREQGGGKDDGKTPTKAELSKLKRPDLVKELKARSIAFPKGAVKNVDLVDLIVAHDKAKG